MNRQESTLTEKKPKPRWRRIGFQLSKTVLLALCVLSFIGFPRDQVADVLQSSALSRLDLLKTKMAIQDELAKNPTVPNSAAVSEVFNSEEWRSLERAVDAHQEHFHEIKSEKRWWDRLYLAAGLVAFIALLSFGKSQTDEDDLQDYENLPAGRKHLWGKLPGKGH